MNRASEFTCNACGKLFNSATYEQKCPHLSLPPRPCAVPILPKFPRKTFCPRCGGTGELEYTRPLFVFWTQTLKAPCVACSGTGEVPVIRLQFHGGVFDKHQLDVTQGDLGLLFVVPATSVNDGHIEQHVYKYRNLAGIRGEEILHADLARIAPL